MSTSTLDDLREKASAGMRAFMLAGNPGPERTIATLQAAEALAEAREHFYDREGAPDLLGRSYEYRLFVRSALDAADVPPGERSFIQNAIRYQMSTILHEKHGEELESRGLSNGSARDRGRRRRDRESAIIRVFGGGGPITSADDLELMANLSRAAFNRVLERPDDADEETADALAKAFTRAATGAKNAAARLSE